MNTFLPYADFDRSAACLDRQRLGKQRVEVLQILRALAGETRGWRNHPATRMWRGHEHSLVDYGKTICREWVNRGYHDSCEIKINEMRHAFESSEPPPWLGIDEFHASHRSNLLRKHREHYGEIGWTEPDDMPYVWPV